MHDLFVGTWKLNPARSEFHRHHHPTEATLHWEVDRDGTYLMNAEGTQQGGERVVERPQPLIPDGRPHPVPTFPGLHAVTSRPEPHVIRTQVRREDGSIAGEATYAVSADGKSLTATTAGFDSQLRQFELRTVWDRQ